MNLKKIIKRISGSKITKNVFFLHIPKCGGRSVEKAIFDEYISFDFRKDRDFVRENSLQSARVGCLLHNYDFENGDINDYQILRFREFYLAYLMYKQKKFIRGHFPFNEKIYSEFKDHYTFITILRDPVQKWLSNYFYRKYRDVGHWMINCSLDQYLESDLAKVHGYDYSKYLGGITKDNVYNKEKNISKAKENLEKFHAIGFLDNLNQFVRDLNQIIETKITIPHINISKKGKEKISYAHIEKIKLLCKTDIEIYNYAKNKFHSFSLCKRPFPEE